LIAFFPWDITPSILLNQKKKLLFKPDKDIINFRGMIKDMVFNATFNNFSVISWRSVLLVEETRVAGENHRPVANHTTPIVKVEKFWFSNKTEILLI